MQVVANGIPHDNGGELITFTFSLSAGKEKFSSAAICVTNKEEGFCADLRRFVWVVSRIEGNI